MSFFEDDDLKKSEKLTSRNLIKGLVESFGLLSDEMGEQEFDEDPEPEKQEIKDEKNPEKFGVVIETDSHDFEEYFKHHFQEGTSFKVHFTKATAIVPINDSNPDGYKQAYLVSGSLNPNERETLEKQLSLLMSDCEVINALVCYKFGNHFSTTHIQNSYTQTHDGKQHIDTEVSRNKNAVGFRIRIAGNESDALDVIQNEFLKMSGNNNFYMPTGHLSSDGITTVFEGFMNPDYEQTDIQKYVNSIIKICRNDMVSKNVTLRGIDETVKVPSIYGCGDYCVILDFVEGIVKPYSLDERYGEKIPKELSDQIKTIENSKMCSKEQTEAIMDLIQTYIKLLDRQDEFLYSASKLADTAYIAEDLYECVANFNKGKEDQEWSDRVYDFSEEMKEEYCSYNGIIEGWEHENCLDY